jgi:hypothetical protein
MPTSANYAGDYEPQGAIVAQASKGTSAAIVKGNVCAVTTGKWNKAATTDTTGPFAVATKAAATADTTCQLLFQGIVYVKCEGAITVNALVQPSTTTAGAVMAYTASTINSTTPTGTQVIAGASDFKRVIGIYLGHENEGDGYTIPTDAADGDTGRILMTAGGV